MAIRYAILRDYLIRDSWRVEQRNVTLDLSWHSIRHVFRDVLNDEMIQVPSLLSASNFGLFSMFVKMKVKLFTISNLCFDLLCEKIHFVMQYFLP